MFGDIMSISIQTLYGSFDEKQLKELKSAVDEICDQMTKIDGMNEYISDICDVTHQNLGLPKKVVKKLAVSKHKQNLSQVVAESNELESLYEAISKV
jgi:methyl-accepting chemotaxis protein